MWSIISSSTEKNKSKEKLNIVKNLLDKYKSKSSAFFDNFDEKKILNYIENVNKNELTPISFKFFSTKNIFSIKEENITGGSETLKEYTAPFTATIIKDLFKSGAINLINSNLDEFGMSGTGLDSCFGSVPNPFNEEYMIGGSSSGSAYLVSKEIVEFAICTDTGDSARVPASNSNIFGYKPSYGLVSRYGLFPFCASFDTPSIMSNEIKIISDVMSIIANSDPNDLTTINSIKKNYSENLNKKPVKKIKIAIFKNTFKSDYLLSETALKIKKEFDLMVEKLKKDGLFEIEYIEFKKNLLELSLLIYWILSFSESISSYSNINGLLFPFCNKTQEPIYIQESKNFKDMMKKIRSKFGNEVIFRQLLGHYFLDSENYESLFIKSKKIVSLINEEMKKIYKEYDFVLSPTVSDIPSKIKDYEKKYSQNTITGILLTANFCGLPGISMPWIFINDLPIGLHLMGEKNKDEYLFQVVNYLKTNNFLNNK